MSETYCLKWKFSDTISQYYQELKESKNFSDLDITLERLIEQNIRYNKSRYYGVQLETRMVNILIEG